MKKFTHRYIGSLSDIENLPASGGAFLPAKEEEGDTSKQASSSEDLIKNNAKRLAKDLTNNGIQTEFSKAPYKTSGSWNPIVEDFAGYNYIIYLELAVSSLSDLDQRKVQNIVNKSQLHKESASGGLKIKVVFWTPFGPSNNPKTLFELES